MANISKLAEMYNKMLLIRSFEEKALSLFKSGTMHGTMHPYIGEEATAVGVCCALEPQDIISSTHRGHGHVIAKGIDINRMMAEFMGKQDGYCRGRGGSMHIADIEGGNLGANGVVGGGIPLAVGAGLTTLMKRMNRIVVCFFGDGASNEGAFHESLNLASLWKLPVLFVCEDNKYGMSTHRSRSMAISDISVRAASYGMPGETVDGNDAIAVYEAAKKARAYVRSSGPMLLVCDTYRYCGHSKSDTNKYRTAEEIEVWKKKDPIERMRAYLIDRGFFTAEELDAMAEAARQRIEDAVAFANNSPYPSPDTVAQGVYA
ncbi:MAG: thiamine pyrophosphate-dependent dehydrogenase E1 component subunit alpha [Christensenellaceae bacterium]|nr:thiamine pyrophosphate-dependent dehydrogenase E1 component subunit alpha [Christensenellaceae bacterium]